jgi:hypothetical protein
VTDQRSKTSPSNGAKSRGPVTLAGKRVSSGNARSHGILSRELLLPSEDPAEFHQLLDELAGELRPVGTLEHTLVERIAIAMWRQRRLVRAENARVLDAQSNDANPVWRSSVDVISEKRGIQEATLLIDELSTIKSNPSLATLSLHEFESRYPHAYKLLQDTLGAPDYEAIGPMDGDFVVGDFYLKLTIWADKQLDEWHDKLPAIVSRDRLCVPNESDKLSRYQSSLDNELYKAMRALRQAQSWRLDVLEPKE